MLGVGKNKLISRLSKPSFHQLLFKRSMRLLQFVAEGKNSLGVEVTKDGAIVDLCKFDSSLPNNMREFLEGGDKFLSIAKR